MVRFATVDDYGWIYRLLEEVFPSRHAYYQAGLAEQIQQKQVIVETDEHSVASFVPNEEYTDVKFNVTNPAYSAVQTSSAILSTYLLYKYRLPLRYYWLRSSAEKYFATKSEYVRNRNTLVGEAEINGETYNWYEFTLAGL